jgi:hypothetical protein
MHAEGMNSGRQPRRSPTYLRRERLAEQTARRADSPRAGYCGEQAFAKLAAASSVAFGQGDEKATCITAERFRLHRGHLT